MNEVKQTITGREEERGIASPFTALVNFYAAFNDQDYELMEANWVKSDEASMSNPLGGIKRGWGEIKEVYKKIFSGPATVYVEFYDYSIHATESMFLAVGRERGAICINKEKIELAIRTSRMYIFNNSRWKQIHHHGSMDNPKLLSRYQTILLGK